MVSRNLVDASENVRDLVTEPELADMAAAGGGLGLGLLSSELVGDRVRQELSGRRAVVQHLGDVGSRAAVATGLAVAGERFGMGDLPGAILNFAAFTAGARAVHRLGEIVWSEVQKRMNTGSSATRRTPSANPSTSRSRSSSSSSTSSKSSGRSKRASMSSSSGSSRGGVIGA